MHQVFYLSLVLSVYRTKDIFGELDEGRGWSVIILPTLLRFLPRRKVTEIENWFWPLVPCSRQIWGCQHPFGAFGSLSPEPSLSRVFAGR